MADLAHLGFAVDSTPLARASTAMRDMVPAAQSAQTAVSGMVGAVNGAKAAADGLVGSTGRAGQSLGGQSAAVKRLADDYTRLSQVQRQINAATGVSGLNMGGDRGADIAAYGQQMDALRAKFNPLFAASKQYENELDDLNGALKVGAITATEHGAALDRMNARYAALDDGTRRAGGSFKGLSFEARNLSFQLVDVTQGLAMGQPVFQIFAQQAGQIGQIIGTTPGGLGGLMKELGRSIAGLLTPMRLVSVGVVAIGAAVTASVLSWKNYALQLDDVRRIAGTTSTALAGLNSAAAVKGIGDDEFFSGMKAFSQSVYEAKINTGSLVTLLRANGAAATDVQSTFGKVADLVKNAKDDIQRMNVLQQAGLPTTRQWIDYMSQGGAKIQLIAAGMKSLGGTDNDAMIEAAKKFDAKWNEAWRNISNGVKSFGLSAITTFDSIANSTSWKTLVAGWQLFQTVRAINSGMAGGGMAVPKTSAAGTPNPTDVLRNSMTNRSDLANSRVSSGFDAFKETAPKQTVDPQAVARALQLEQQRLTLLGSTTTAEEAALAVQLQANQASANGVPVNQKRIDILKQLAREQSLGITQIKSSIDSYNIESATIGMSAGAAAQYAAAQNAINDAKRAGRALTQDNIASINAQAAALGEAAAKADLMNAAYSGLVRGPLQTLTSQIANGAKFFDALKSAGISALNAIASKLADMAAQSLWTNALGGAVGGSGGGLLGKLFGGASSATAGLGGLAAIHHAGGIAGDSAPMRYIHPAYFDNATRYHTGGIAGLAPDEVPAILQRGERIIPRGQAGNDNGAVNVPVTVNIDATGADAAGLARVAQSVADLKANLPGLAVKAVQGARKRRVAV